MYGIQKNILIIGKKLIPQENSFLFVRDVTQLIFQEELVKFNIYLFSTLVNKPPTTINMIGEKDDNGPINPVRFMFPKFPNKKSIAPSAINMYPIIFINIFYFDTGVPSR